MAREGCKHGSKVCSTCRLRFGTGAELVAHIRDKHPDHYAVFMADLRRARVTVPTSKTFPPTARHVGQKAKRVCPECGSPLADGLTCEYCGWEVVYQ